MKSVMHLALIAPGGYSNAGLMKGFLENNFLEYYLFDYQLKTFEFGKEVMRRMLIQEAERLRPDMIFMQIQGSDILDLETFQILSRISFTVNYTFDIRTKEKTEWLYNLAPILGLICFSNQRDVDECKARGFNDTMVLQSSCDMELYKPLGNVARKGVVFIGNNFENTNHQFPLSTERAAMVEFLQKEFTDQFKIYGNNWPASRMIMQKEEVEILQSAQIVICQNNFDAELYFSDRIWRTMSFGALCLTKYVKGIESLFIREKHLDWWYDFDQLRDFINYYLDNPIKAEEIAINGMDHVHENHSWTARIKEMMTFINSKIKAMESNSCTIAGAHVIDGIIPLPTDEYFNNRVCDCGRTKWVWAECGCGEKTYQLRVQENI